MFELASVAIAAIKKRPMIACRAIVFLATVVTPAACGFCGGVQGQVEGSGNLNTETRDVGSFTRIAVSGGANVELTVDPNLSQSVSVTYDDNVIDFIVTRVNGNTLVIDTEGSFRTSGGGRFVTVVTDRIEVIKASGGADVIGNGVIESYRLRASGGSDVDLLKLQASSVEIDASGGTDVWVFASESITGEASGAAEVEVYGSPANVNISKSGVAEVSLQG